MKSPGAKTNTHDIQVRGMLAAGSKATAEELLVFFTSDALGETLSIASERTGILLAVPFEKVEKLIQQTRRER